MHELDNSEHEESWQPGKTGSTTEWFGDVPTVTTFVQDDLRWITFIFGKSQHH